MAARQPDLQKTLPNKQCPDGNVSLVHVRSVLLFGRLLVGLIDQLNPGVPDNHFVPAATYCDQRVCVSVPLSANISPKPDADELNNRFVYALSLIHI